MNTLLEQLNNLKQQGADSYNPTRFCFIQSLVRRAAKQRHSVREQLESKAQMALDAYQKAMVQKTMALAQKNTALVADTSTTPASVKIPTTLLPTTLPAIPTTLSALASLTQYLLKPANEHMPNNEQSIARFSEQLQQQTHSLLEKSHCLLSLSDKKTDATVPIDTPLALKSSTAYQQHQEKKRVDDFIDIALKQTPENPGPLNPEILAIGLLKSVRNLSPEYLSRYVSYFETLQRLNHEGG